MISKYGASAISNATVNRVIWVEWDLENNSDYARIRITRRKRHWFWSWRSTLQAKPAVGWLTGLETSSSHITHAWLCSSTKRSVYHFCTSSKEGTVNPRISRLRVDRQIYLTFAKILTYCTRNFIRDIRLTRIRSTCECFEPFCLFERFSLVLRIISLRRNILIQKWIR